MALLKNGENIRATEIESNGAMTTFVTVNGETSINDSNDWII